MYLLRFPLTNRNSRADSSTSNVPTHNLSGRDSESERPPEYSPTDSDALGVAGAPQVATSNYVYYRIYAEDGAIPSKTPVAPSDPFLGRIKIRSVPPPRTVKAVRLCIAKMENIKDRGSTSLFLTSYGQSPMDDTEKVTILNGAGPGSTPQEPIALLAKMSDFERSDLESGRSGGLSSAAEPGTTPPGIRYVYYQLYADHSEFPSKVGVDPEEPSLGRIRADCVAPPHSPTSIKRCISRVEGNPELLHSDLFADTTCDTPLAEGHISILPTDGPGLNANEPMAIVQSDVQVESVLPVKMSSIPDGRYVIKNRAAVIYWSAENNRINSVLFWPGVSAGVAISCNHMQWDITNDANGNVSMTSPYNPSSWVGHEFTGSTVPVPWRLIPADSESYYLTTDLNHSSQNPRVPAAQEFKHMDYKRAPGEMATLKKGDQKQMWEFIRI